MPMRTVEVTTVFPLQRLSRRCEAPPWPVLWAAMIVVHPWGGECRNLSVTTCYSRAAGSVAFTIPNLSASISRLHAVWRFDESNAVTSFELEIDWTAQTILPIECGGPPLHELQI